MEIFTDYLLFCYNQYKEDILYKNSHIGNNRYGSVVGPVV